MLRFMRVPAVVIALGLLVLAAMHAGAVAPGNPAFQSRWERTDDPVLGGRVSRTWIWGPEANTNVMSESYQDAPGGQRQVQYYDKSRMEINNPNGNPNDLFFVTNGLLVVELMSGNLQLGDAKFESHNPAVVNVAGDSDDPAGPTYVTLAALRSLPALGDNALITQRVNRAGQVTNDPGLSGQNIRTAQRLTVPGIDHQIAAPFWEFMNSSGLVKVNGQYVNEALFTNPYYATGFPITEAYWADVKVAGTTRLVLMQCFERRCLTYTPGNPAGFATEAGNVGQHYHTWRYVQIPNEGGATATSTSGKPTATSPSVATATSAVVVPTDYVYQMGIGRPTDASRKMLEPWAVAQDVNSNLYVLDLAAVRVQKFDSNGEFVTQWGSLGTGNVQFDHPSDIAVGPDGNLYVVDTRNHRVKVFNTNGGFVKSIGEQGTTEGRFLYPTGIAFDSSGNIYVTDGFNHRVQKFDSTGDYQTTWGQFGAGPSEFQTPSAIAISSDDEIYVTELGNGRVQVFNTNGVFQRTFGSTGSGDGQLMTPGGIMLGFDGESVIVSDTGNNRLQIFDGNGDWVGSIGTAGAGELQFNAPQKIVQIGGGIGIADSGNGRIQVIGGEPIAFVAKLDGDSRGTFAPSGPGGIAINPANGNIVVVDQNANRVKVFDSDGSFVGEWGDVASANADALNRPRDVAIGPNGLLYVADAFNQRIAIYDGAGNFQQEWGGPLSGLFSMPSGVAVDPAGNVYVTEYGTNRVQKFNSAGQFLTKWGSFGVEPSQFDGPTGIYATATRVYVVDSRNARIQVFEPDGDFLFQFGSFGMGDGQFYEPVDVTVDAAGYVYVTEYSIHVVDASNNRVQKFTPTGQYVAQFGTRGSGDGQLIWPTGIALLPGGAVVVADSGNARLQVFAPAP